ncbi:hypothetical protein [Carboxydothermus ferrireducens]|uniref:Uncharacterized protein n=1 Tax=Carboxydothermus ferrireducens DSM 11255 TaxID=1119529 RepID=A0ABX2R7G9_9THEO|nr:hypothetical protein [Carboxydothermus ferrireducens]NYE57107.1 hypothetical protein [Carboxydothermus ferrireducens DSM 11255]
MLSPEARKLYEKLYLLSDSKETFEEFLKEYQTRGFVLEDSKTILDKSFCIAELLNDYQQFKKLTQEEYELLFDFAVFLEQILNVCRGE